ncbi:MAG: cell wall-active antibiotics response protein LiaF [Clostridiales bacterium]|nr:cell wall-active antibiotics response protein LiaF [Clostridiales bacterium]
MKDVFDRRVRVTNLVFGSLVIIVGVIFALVNLGVIEGEVRELIWDYWPVLIIVWGFTELQKIIVNLIEKRKVHLISAITTVVIAIGFGLVLLGNNLNWFAEQISFWSILWPTAFVYIGLQIIFGDLIINKKSSKHFNFSSSSNDYKEKKSSDEGFKTEYKLVGEIDKGREPWVLDDLDLYNVAGETKINLATALINEGEVTVNIRGLAGEIEILVPIDLAVKVRARVLAGEVKLFAESAGGITSQEIYVSDNYEDAIKKVKIDLELKAGEINVRWVK